MKPHRNLRFQGRFGNTLFQYARAKSICERDGFELRVAPWLGQECFKLSDPQIEGDVPSDFVGFAQTQDDLIYTRRDVLRWFQWKPELAMKLNREVPNIDEAVGHLRRGDYDTNVYVLVSRNSYLTAAERFEPNAKFDFLCEEFPTAVEGVSSWIPDFWRMVQAPILFRANSTFSWWAATLGDHEKVYSPVITGHKPGGPRECQFVLGNHPKFAELPNVTDLRLAP